MLLPELFNHSHLTLQRDIDSIHEHQNNAQTLTICCYLTGKTPKKCKQLNFKSHISSIFAIINVHKRSKSIESNFTNLGCYIRWKWKLIMHIISYTSNIFLKLTVTETYNLINSVLYLFSSQRYLIWLNNKTVIVPSPHRSSFGVPQTISFSLFHHVQIIYVGVSGKTAWAMQSPLIILCSIIALYLLYSCTYKWKFKINFSSTKHIYIYIYIYTNRYF